MVVDLEHRLKMLSLDYTESDQLEAENNELRKRLQEVRNKRQQIQSLQRKQESFKEALLERLNKASYDQQEQLLTDFQSASLERDKNQHSLNLYQYLNVTNDCFHIWHEGPFATINGLRLGAEAPPPCGNNNNNIDDNDNNDGDGDPASSSATASGGDSTSGTARRYLYFPGAFANRNSNNVNNNNNNQNNNTLAQQPPPPPPIKVPWKEINAALGQVALLLSTLERKPQCGIKFRYEIKPAGSTSKIGVRQSVTSSLTLYNLYYLDDSFTFFGKRNFNTALQYLVQCVADTAEVIQSRDRTIMMPYEITNKQTTTTTTTTGRRGGGHTELSIGGLPVAHGTDDVEWTRAMKYLLTNIKHLMIYKPFELWS